MRPNASLDSTATQALPLRMLFWESTSLCNLACAHCRRQDVAEAAARDDLTTDEVRGVLDSAATLGRPIIVLSGGEPLLRGDWEPLAAHARTLGLPTALATNGTLIDDVLARRVAAAGFRRVSVSLDGADAATHDAFRRVPGAYGKAVAGVAALRRAGVPIQINATIAGHNTHQLDDLYALAERLGAMALHLFLLVPVGCGAEIGPTHQLPPADYEKVLNWVLDRQAGGHPRQGRGEEAGLPGNGGSAARGGMAVPQPIAGGSPVLPLELKATCAPHYHRLAAQRGIDLGPSRGCLGGVAVAFVSHAGEVFPCGYLPVSCGSVRQRGLADIWRSSDVLAALRDYARLSGKCGLCEYKGICGGCRARAFAATGDYLAAEPACSYRPQ